MAAQTRGAAQVVPPAVGVVNGPEDGVTDRATIGRRAVENGVRRLRQQIFAARRQGTARAPSWLEPSGPARAGCPESGHGRFRGAAAP